jgi:hypothetical protein
MRRILLIIAGLLLGVSSAHAASCSGGNPCIQSQIVDATGGGGGALTNTITFASNVTSGSTVLWAFHANSATAITVSDTIGGTEHTLKTACPSGCDFTAIANTYDIWGYTTGGSGAGAIKGAQTTAFTISGGVAEVKTGWTIDSGKTNFANNTSTSTTVSVATNGATSAADYLWTFSVDAAGNGYLGVTIGTFTLHDTGTAFPSNDADYTQPSAGTTTAAWTGFNSASKPSAEIIAMVPPVSTVVPRRR